MQPDPSAATSVPTSDRTPRLPRRAQGDRYLGGVAGGIANRFAIDPFIVRAAFLGTTLFTAYAADWVPIVPAIYTLLWLLFPGPANRSVARNLRSAAGRREGVAAVASFVVIAVLLTRPIFGFALGLAALAWVLLSDDAQPPGTHRGPSRSVGNDATSEATPTQLAEPGADPATRGNPDALDSASSLWGRSRRFERGEELVSPFSTIGHRHRRRPALWPLTLSLLVILAIGGAMADALLDPGLDPAVLVNSALIVIGGVLLLSAWKGRALWTALLAVALLPAWIGFSVADIGRFDGYGNVTYTPTSIPDSGTLDYANGYGSMTIDLRGITFQNGDTLALNVGTTAGTVTVLAPPQIETLLHSKIGFGTSTFQGNGVDFFDYDREPFVDRFMVRRYEAHGQGCIDDYWASWALLVDNHAVVGVDLGDLSANNEDDVDALLAAIEAAGFSVPVPVLNDNGYSDLDYAEPPLAYPVLEPANVGSYRVIDEYGNEYYVDNSPLPIEVQQQFQPQTPFEQAVQDRTWSYAADFDGAPCIPTPAPTNPATVEINATIGIGQLEVRRDQI